jgi:hypothetical protein
MNLQPDGTALHSDHRHFLRSPTWWIGSGLLVLILIFLALRMVEKSHKNYRHVHDGALDTEYALDLLVQGRNIYSEDVPEDYFGPNSGQLTVRGANGELVSIPNPALYHYVYPPLLTLQSLPLYCLLKSTLHWFDQRLMLIPYLVFLVWFSVQLPASEITRCASLGLLVNPSAVQFFLTGRNDIVVFCWLLMSVLFLHEARSKPALLTLGIACLMKQTAWIFVPFIYLFLYHQWQPISLGHYLKRAARESLWPLLLGVAVMLPFALWDFHGLWEDLILYPAGKLPTSYPVNGYSLLAWLIRWGYLESIVKYYPIVWVQVPVYFLILVWTHFRLKKHPTVDTLLLQVTCGIFAFWFLSRFYHNNYVEFTLRILALSWVFRQMRRYKSQKSSAGPATRPGVEVAQ